MTIIQTEYLPFEECTKETQDKILEKHRYINVGHEWYNCLFDDIKGVLTLVGWDDINIHFSGFWSQGDGAQFNGYYFFDSKKLAKVKKEYPKWKSLHDFVRVLEQCAVSNGRDLYIKISQSGNYSHENCTRFNIERSYYNLEVKKENEIVECCKEFMRNIYKILNDEYGYLTSEEAVKETIECNGYEFDQEGNIL